MFPIDISPNKHFISHFFPLLSVGMSIKDLLHIYVKLHIIIHMYIQMPAPAKTTANQLKNVINFPNAIRATSRLRK